MRGGFVGVGCGHELRGSDRQSHELVIKADSQRSGLNLTRRRASLVHSRGGRTAMKRFQNLKHAFRSEGGRFATPSMLPAARPYRVGELFLCGHRRWPEGTQLVLAPDRIELTLFRREPTARLLADVQRGEAELALIVDMPVIVLAYRIGEFGVWNDVPFSWHLQPTERRIVPRLDDSAEARALLWISLVDAQDGIIRAQRGMTMSPAFTSALQRTVPRKRWDPSIQRNAR